LAKLNRRANELGSMLTVTGQTEGVLRQF
jgi:hypothetical protein